MRPCTLFSYTECSKLTAERVFFGRVAPCKLPTGPYSVTVFHELPLLWVGLFSSVAVSKLLRDFLVE